MVCSKSCYNEYAILFLKTMHVDHYYYCITLQKDLINENKIFDRCTGCFK